MNTIMEDFWGRDSDGVWHWWPAADTIHLLLRAPSPKRRRHRVAAPPARICVACWMQWAATTTPSKPCMEVSVDA